MEYTELELNKMIAELEGYKPVIIADMVKTNDSFNYAPIECSSKMGANNYNKNKAKLYDLMVKYKVEIDYLDFECSIWREDLIEAKATTRFKQESEIPRAIIMCILKSENII